MKLITTKENDAGVMKVFESDTTTKYDIFTFAGKYRGGKIYFADKVVNILSWKAIITMEIDGKDTTIHLSPEDNHYTIPSWIPNIFYYLEDTHMTEKFPKGTKTENFERYRDMKKRP